MKKRIDRSWMSVPYFCGFCLEETVRMYSFMSRHGFRQLGKTLYQFDLLLDIKKKMKGTQ